MNSKSNTTASKENGKPALVPKLRFPEFRGTSPWAGKPMGEVYSFKSNNSLSRDQLNYEQGSVKNIHYGDIHTKFSTLFDITKEKVPFINTAESLDGFRPDNDCVEGDMIFADASEDLADIGKSIEIVRLHGERVVSGQHTILARPNGDILVVGFGAYLFKSRYVRTQIQKESQGSKVLGISATRLTKIRLPIPIAKPEQQKIAECLSSVDELSAAQARKVDALKTHKKGLMQQLFPREGETQPRLRFPEFQNAGEWEPKSLGGLCRIRTGKKDANEGAEDGAYPFFTCAAKHTYSHSYSFDTEAILIAGNANVGQTNYYNGKFEAYQRTYVLTDFTGMFVPYLYSVLNANLRPDLLAQVQTSAMSYIRLPMLEEYQINAPSSQAEQQRIADCLTRLDDLIAAQTQTLEALKTHKQGLMQQLFPSPEAASA